MRILVFGKTGQVATCLQQQATVTALGRDAVDLTDTAAVRAAVDRTEADVIINAAAYTAVDKAESDTDTAEAVNHHAPAAMAKAAATRGIPFLHISTDYVFPGDGAAPWQPDDATGPLGVYGASKLRGEDAVRAVGGPHAILRTSWVFSAHGANFVKTMLRLGKERDSLTVVADQIGGPTPAADIATALLTMAQRLHGNSAPSGTYHFSGAPDASWADFAAEIFAQAGLSCAVTPIPSSAYPTPAKRPLNSRLDCTSLYRDYGIARPDWRLGLAAVLTELGETT